MPLSDIDCGAEDNSKRLDIAMRILEQARRRYGIIESDE